MQAEAIANLREALDSLFVSRLPESRVLIEQGPVYLQFVRQPGRGTQLEAVSSSQLPAEFKLSSGRAMQLREMGFEKCPGENWKKVIPTPNCLSGNDPDSKRFDTQLLIKQCREILDRVYGAEGEIQVQLAQTQEHHPDNDELVASMRNLAEQRSSEARHRMYTELVNATLLIPVRPEAPEEVQSGEDFLVTDTLEGHPVFLAFSDWDSLRRWNPRGWSYVPLHGSEFFELTLERDLGSVQINPRGEVGGELYRHEVEMLVEGVRNYRRMMMN